MAALRGGSICGICTGQPRGRFMFRLAGSHVYAMKGRLWEAFLSQGKKF